MDEMQRPIGVFDSGVGGISVLRELVALMPNENFIFYGDSKNAPYGTKTLEEVSELLKDTLEEHEYPVEIRVITERPYFHFKTNRKELTAQILEELKQAE